MRLVRAALTYSIVLAAVARGVVRADPGDQFTESVWMTRIITERTSQPLLQPEGGEPRESSATAMAWAPDGSRRLFVTMQDGTVGVVLHGGAPEDRVAVVFTTIDPIYTAGECGLLGLTFDPNFLRNHFIYFFVTVSDHEQQIIRYTDDDSFGKNKTVIVAGLPTAGDRHNGGALGIGPDNKLYWGIGDHADGTGVDADLTSLSAKIGRANLDGTVPDDNPFVDGNGPNADYIWARGMRNPFTLTFQPETGALWVNVVGERYEQTFIVNAGDHAGYIAHEDDQPAGYLAPVIAYRTTSADTLDTHLLTANGASRLSGIATFETVDPHGFRPGQSIYVDGTGDTSFNLGGLLVVASTPSPTTLTALLAGPDVSTGGGRVTAQWLGRCITGGTFYGGNAFPPEYRSNYFFGDWVSGSTMRAVLSSPETIEQVSLWRSRTEGRPIDIETGPDGALYYLVGHGEILRDAFIASSEAIVVSKTTVWMSQGGAQSIDVSLATDPGTERLVTAARAAGSSRIGLTTGASLRFDSTNWDVPQAVIFDSTIDPAAQMESAVFELTSPGLTTESVTVHATEDSRSAVVAVPSLLHVDEGANGTIDLSLASQPDHVMQVAVTLTGSDHLAIASGATLSFTPQDFAAPQSVEIDAMQDPDAVSDSATVAISVDGTIVRALSVVTIDDEAVAPAITSSSTAKFVEGIVNDFPVTTTGSPEVSLVLLDRSPGLSISDGSNVSGRLFGGTRSVTLIASNGVGPIAIQTLEISPTLDCLLTAPAPNAVVSGPKVTFTAVVVDEGQNGSTIFYYVDGNEVAGLSGVAGVNWGGLSIEWNTTAYTDGPHHLKIRAEEGYPSPYWTCEAEIDVTVDNVPGPDPEPETDAGLDLGPEPDSGLLPTDGPSDPASHPGDDGGEHADASVVDAGRSNGADASPDMPATNVMKDAAAGSMEGRRDASSYDADAGMAADAGSGCTCRVAPARLPRVEVAMLVLLVCLRAGRRRRARARKVGRVGSSPSHRHLPVRTAAQSAAQRARIPHVHRMCAPSTGPRATNASCA